MQYNFTQVLKYNLVSEGQTCLLGNEVKKPVLY